MLSTKKIKKLIEENSAVFKALEDFEKTGRVITKIRMNFTIDREISNRFKKYCKDKGENMSAEVEKFMKNKVKGLNL